MAIDKSRTPVWMKAVLIVIAAAFVFMIGGSSALGFCAPQADVAPTGSTATGNTTATLDAIASGFTSTTAANEEAIKKDPKNYDLLLAQGRSYHDWAVAIMQTAQSATQDGGQADPAMLAAATPVWLSAVEYYERAVKIKEGDPNVETDLAVARFYSNDIEGAIADAVRIRKANPKFTPVLFNLGIFYANAGRTSDAIKTFEDYLKLEPSGDQATSAKEMIAQLKAAPAPTQPAPTQP